MESGKLKNSSFEVHLMTEDGQILLQVKKEKDLLGESNLPSEICQPTLIGETKNGERSLMEAIKRTCVKDLGEKFAEKFNLLALYNFSIVEFIEEGEKCKHFGYWARIDKKDLGIMESSSKTKPNFLPLNKEELRLIKKTKVFSSEEKVLMFPELKETLRQLFKVLEDKKAREEEERMKEKKRMKEKEKIKKKKLLERKAKKEREKKESKETRRRRNKKIVFIESAHF